MLGNYNAIVKIEVTLKCMTGGSQHTKSNAFYDVKIFLISLFKSDDFFPIIIFRLLFDCAEKR